MRKHTRFIIPITAIAALVAFVVWYASSESLPSEIRIATGNDPKGLNYSFAEDFKRPLRERTGRNVTVKKTKGSEENIQLLLDGKAELATFQIHSLPPDGIAVIAPIFIEPLHFIVRKGKGINSVADLPGKKVAVGLERSGMRANAIIVLEHFGLKVSDLRVVDEPYGALDDDPELDAALITTGWNNERLKECLKQPNIELVGIADTEGLAARNPWFTATTIPAGLYSGKPPVPTKPVPTVAVMSALAARADASDRLVRESLAALYKTADLRKKYPALLTANAAKNYDATAMHPVVASYHDPNAGLNSLSWAMDLFVKAKETLITGALGLLFLWKWRRDRRKEAAKSADEAQKKKLDDFINQSQDVEWEQMPETDPEKLRTFLRYVTWIKQEALQELTSESVRGDQLFAIFHAQCAALSDKIQNRMIYGMVKQNAGSTLERLTKSKEESAPIPIHFKPEDCTSEHVDKNFTPDEYGYQGIIHMAYGLKKNEFADRSHLKLEDFNKNGRPVKRWINPNKGKPDAQPPATANLEPAPRPHDTAGHDTTKAEGGVLVPQK